MFVYDSTISPLIFFGVKVDLIMTDPSRWITPGKSNASKQQMISSQTLWPHVFFQGTHHHHWPAGQEAEGMECLEPSLDLWLVAAGSHLDISLPLFNNIIHKMDSTIIVDDPRKSRHINPVSSDCRLPVLKNPHFLKSNISISPISAYQYHQYHRHVLSTLNLPPFIKPFL